jgi:membrane protein implicated in regulation of membrane protease activity
MTYYYILSIIGFAFLGADIFLQTFWLTFVAIVLLTIKDTLICQRLRELQSTMRRKK